MVDVVFTILIFFVVTSSSELNERLLPTELPAAGAVPSLVAPAQPKPLTVEIWLKVFPDDAARTVVEMNGTVYRDLEDLKAQLRALAQLAPENPVVLDINPDVPLGDVVDLYDTCQAGGFETVNFAADVNE
jgi:biopolymer transport protein ExbD